jgi:hypothetical protein
MKIEQAIENLKIEINDLDRKINLPILTVCNHQICDICLKNIDDENEVKNNLKIILSEKSNLLANLVSLI